jgi:2-dehydro-3-deoxy-D-pentonate aldolase
VKLPAPLRGVVTAMITPLLDRDTLDVTGLERLIANLIGGEVNGRFILGTTGEAPSLSYQTRREVIPYLSARRRSEYRTLLGLGTRPNFESLRRGRHAADVEMPEPLRGAN